MNSENETTWSLAKKGNRHVVTVRAKRTNTPSKSAVRRMTRKKIVETFFEEDDLPDELFQMGLSVSTENQNNSFQPEPQPQKLGENEKVKVQEALVDFFREGYIRNISKGESVSSETILNYINTILVTYKIKISGGFVLKNMGMFEGNTGSTSIDIDIYLPNSQIKNPYKKRHHTQTIHTILQNLFNVDIVKGKPKYKYFRVSHSVSKKQAFFQKNGIYSVTKYSKGENAEMDLVQSDATTTPIGIIQRFDLTFCQNWYDGENLYSMDPEAVYKRAPGHLEDSYVSLYLDGNPVTRKRIAKYMKRGFRVEYNDPETGNPIDITEDNVKNKNNS